MFNKKIRESLQDLNERLERIEKVLFVEDYFYETSYAVDTVRFILRGTAMSFVKLQSLRKDNHNRFGNFTKRQHYKNPKKQSNIT